MSTDGVLGLFVMLHPSLGSEPVNVIFDALKFHLKQKRLLSTRGGSLASAAVDLSPYLPYIRAAVFG